MFFLIFTLTQVTSYYCQFRLYQHHTFGLLSNFIITQDPIVNYNFHHAATQNPVVIYNFHHVVTQDPGHSTKFVTLPSSYLTLKVYDRSGSMCFYVFTYL